MDLTTKELKAVKHILKLTNGLDKSEEITILNNVLQKAVAKTENEVESRVIELAKEIMGTHDLNLAQELANEIIETVCPGYFEYPF